MSLSLIGIILVQVYWFNSSFKNNDEQFKFHVTEVISHVAEKIQKKEEYTYYERFNKYKDSTGKLPEKSELLEFYYVQKNLKNNTTVVFTNKITSNNYTFSPSFFNKKSDSVKFKSFNSKRVTEVYDNNRIDNSKIQNDENPNLKIEKTGDLDVLDQVANEINYKEIASSMPIQERTSIEDIHKLLDKQLKEYGVTTKFEFGIFSSGLATKIKSNGFVYDENNTYSIPIFTDNENSNKYQLLVSFPNKKKFLLSDIIGITVLSIIFTLIIIIAYSSALNQLILQRNISEIKTDFINNMTHEFKTPIATINLALDAIRNPKIIDDKEKVFKYLQMIKDENKRMHAQVENVLRISKLEKKELDISKENINIHEVIEDAIEHVSLILEDKNGLVEKEFNAYKSSTLLNEVHFINVIVNILENAIKYSTNTPKILISTDNIKDFLIIKIKDHGIGISKVAQKRIFEKFYREHTGDLHDVKGHGLGLAYVKKIVDEHDGQISVESEKGKGSTFIIKLPLTK